MAIASLRPGQAPRVSAWCAVEMWNCPTPVGVEHHPVRVLEWPAQVRLPSLPAAVSELLERATTHSKRMP
jgi:hypothetical protein